MNALSEVRKQVADSYKAVLDGLEFYGVVPPKATPPFGYVAPDAPYLSFDDETLTYGEVLVRLRVVLVVAAGANDVRADELDELVLKALPVDAAPFVLNEVDEPGRLLVNAQEHLAVSLHLAGPVRLED